MILPTTRSTVPHIYVFLLFLSPSSTTSRFWVADHMDTSVHMAWPQNDIEHKNKSPHICFTSTPTPTPESHVSTFQIIKAFGFSVWYNAELSNLPKQHWWGPPLPAWENSFLQKLETATARFWNLDFFLNFKISKVYKMTWKWPWTAECQKAT